MGNQVRYVDLGLVSKEMYTGIWEYGNLIDINCPTVIKFSSKKHIVDFFGNSKLDISSFFNGEIKYPTVRACEDPGNIPDDKLAYWIEGPNVFNFILYSSSDVKQLFLQSIRECCFKFGIETFWNGRNDIFFKIGNKQKKFFGCSYEVINDWHVTSGTITYQFDSKLATKVKELDINNVLKTPKFESDSGNVSDVVGGLWEVDSTIDPIKFNDEFLKILVKKLGGTLEKNNLSDEEMQLLISRGKKRLEDEEWMLRGNNENFI
jgi:hypothetical protein